jgi:hypothetical protein
MVKFDWFSQDLQVWCSLEIFSLDVRVPCTIISYKDFDVCLWVDGVNRSLQVLGTTSQEVCTCVLNISRKFVQWMFAELDHPIVTELKIMQYWTVLILKFEIYCNI